MALEQKPIGEERRLASVATAMKVNVLGLVGAVIGVVAVFSVWYSTFFLPYWPPGRVYISMNLIDVLNEWPAYHIAWFSGVIFIIATLGTFVSPSGGILQIAGVMLWWTYVFQASGKMPSEIGSYVGLASAVISLTSIVRPIGPGLAKGPFSFRNRLLIFSGWRS